MLAFKADKRQTLWDRVQGEVGVPVPKEHKKDKAEWLKPGPVGRVTRRRATRSCASQGYWRLTKERGQSWVYCTIVTQAAAAWTLIIVELHCHNGTAL
ncbi:hypothetical protein X735_30120 [Mesorhizobium sp. L2C085B000]|nr:hypothetical protein X736_33065 [Mesorhizobium sp. L2C089B000]ESZ08562.1 hypothetical protein X735_30120 [Mesorhizobium sp. L2C085B000]ESZ38792.1 hypothetical protein X731_28085 [Mesorhizobium sp. L2C054A000]